MLKDNPLFCHTHKTQNNVVLYMVAALTHKLLLPLQGTAQVKEGDVVVVTAAAGGTGHFAVQVRTCVCVLLYACL